jgi:hypothetical protein
MKKLFTLALAVFAACVGISAQYCSTTKGQVLKFHQTSQELKADFDVTTTIIAVDRDDNGVISVRQEEKQPSHENAFEDQITYSGFRYNPADTTTTVILMAAGDFKKLFVDGIRAMAAQAGQYLTADQLNEINDALKTSGELALQFSPNAAVGSKIPSAKLSCSAEGQSIDVRVTKALFQGFEEVETPAGKFNCAKLTYMMRYVGMGLTPDEYVTSWYAEGVGLVREIYADKKGNQNSETILTSITNPAE